MYPQASGAANIMLGGPSSSANQMRLISKQAELEGLRALKDQSARMVKELERLAEKVDIMADGGDCKCFTLTVGRVSRSSIADFFGSFCCAHSNRFGYGFMARRVPRHSDCSR